MSRIEQIAELIADKLQPQIPVANQRATALKAEFKVPDGVPDVDEIGKLNKAQEDRLRELKIKLNTSFAAVNTRKQALKEYSDGTTATGSEPLPELSPRQQDTKQALGHLDDVEAMHGRNGSTIVLRCLIERLGA